MKLRNKKTGEILAVQHKVALLHFSNGTTSSYHSLAELNKDWEDVPEGEPEEYWYIYSDGSIYKDSPDAARGKIGNRFDTREKAERAVRRLRALKRLRDYGLKLELWYAFEGDYDEHSFADIHLDIEPYDGVVKDLEEAFGDE